MLYIEKLFEESVEKSHLLTLEKIGQEFVIVDRTSRHKFDIGTVVTFVGVDSFGFRFESEDDYWWCYPSDVVLLETEEE